MNTKKTAYLLMFCLVLGSSGVAYGAPEDTRYLVKSSSNFWKKSFGVRYQFDEGFSTDLTDWQLRVARMFGVELVAVKRLYVLTEPDTDVSETPIVEIKAKPTPNPTVAAGPARALPSNQIPWGVKDIYNNNLITKTEGGAGVNVAVLDTGVLKTHLDLKNNISQCKDFTGVKIPVTDGKCDDKNGHGTHVAGVIAADGGDDGLGIYGIAPESKIYAYKVCGTNGSCWSDDIAFAIRTAVNENANIISMSLGGDSESSLVKDAISYAVSKGVLVVAAAGNDGPYAGSIDYPGANMDVIAVGAFDTDFNIAEWSSRGINSTTEELVVEEGDIEFAAPGVNIESTWKDGGYVILSGTSMATPHISGLAAKEWQKEADNPATATRDLLHTFSWDLNPAGDDDSSGFGFPHLGSAPPGL